MGRSNTQVAVDVVDAAGDAIGDVTEDLADLAEAAASTAAVVGRTGFRIVGRTIRFVARHPREVLAGVVIVTVAAAAARFVRSRSSESPS
ncbi:MAG: hypothetical protein R8G01_18750 [Ilumatobacteraceae bacterium]|nr:hypothetical protein [Ilumatobacteraceae bacterium]